MEVLISMFVLAVGLLGVAALIPAGRHEIVEATKLETSAMVGRNAFRDLQIRGYLNPKGWWSTAENDFVYKPANTQPFRGRLSDNSNFGDLDYIAYAIDPLGLTAADSFGPYFPYVVGGTPLGPTPLIATPMLRIMPSVPTSNARECFDNIFRSSVDLTTKPNTSNKDLPPVQEFFRDPPGTGTVLLRRMSDGNYSWLATVVSDPTKPPQSGEVNVSVAVFYKRAITMAPTTPPEALGEYVCKLSAFPVLPMTSGGEAILNELPNNPITNKPVAVKPGQWIMLSGRRVLSTTPTLKAVYQYRWYRVLSAAQPVTSGTVTSQRVTLSGTDWILPHTSTQAWIFDNIVSVYEKSLPLEIQ
jgi:hypothetical protein